MDFECFAQPNGKTVGDRLIVELEGGRWSEFRAAVAFAKMSGVEYLDGPLRRFVAGGGRTTLSVGIDHMGTSFEALSQLRGALAPPSELYITTHVGPPTSTFHPKLFAFLSRDVGGDLDDAFVICGSTNFTEGGLFTNHEFSIGVSPDLSDSQDVKALEEVLDALDVWASASSGLSTAVSPSVLVEFYKRGWLPSEEQITKTSKRAASAASGRRGRGGGKPPGALKKQPKPPRPAHSRRCGAPAIVGPERSPARRSSAPKKRAPAGKKLRTLCIDITAPTDKTEIYLSKIALAEDPRFFGHPFRGLTKPKKATSVPQPERRPRPRVDLRLLDGKGSVVSEYRDHPLKMWQYVNGPSANQDVRITIPAELLRSLPAGCILSMQKYGAKSKIEYRLDFLTPGSRIWEHARKVASTDLPGKKRKYGWA